MATTPTKTGAEATTPLAVAEIPAWPGGRSIASSFAKDHPEQYGPAQDHSAHDQSALEAVQKPSQRDALQALLAFSALHEQVRRRRALAVRSKGFDAVAPLAEFEEGELFVLDEVLQLVAERAVAITGADGLAIALAEDNEIVLRASAGTVRPDVGARIDRDSAFSGACFRQAQVVSCDDTETDPRVNLQACRRLGARSMIAVPLCGRRRVIGVLEAFFAWPFGFNDSDIRNLTLLAELVVGALKPEDEDRFAQSAQVAEAKLEATKTTSTRSVATPPTAPNGPATQPSSPASPLELAPAPVTGASVKPAQPEIALPPAAAVPVGPAIAPEKTPDSEVALSTQTAADNAAAEPELTFKQLEPAANRRPGMLVLLVCIVIATAIAGGVWWKWKTAQLGSEMITEKTAPKSSTAGSPPGAAPQTSVSATANPADSASTSPAAADAGEPVLTPATPEELAKFPRVTGIRHWSSADSSTVVLDLEDQVQYEAHRLSSPDRIYFDLHDTQLAPDLAGKSIDVGEALLHRIRVAQPVAGLTRVVLEIKADSNFSVSLEPNPYRLVVEVRKIGATPKGAVNLFPNVENNKLAIVVPPPTREDLQLRARVPKLRIVVDAGHGGWDLGTVGRRGLLEKDLVLEIAQRLGKLLETRLGADVIFTRNDDSYIPLDDRAEIANQAQADLFVSVHANYSDLPSARGVETYYTTSFSAPASKESGSRESGLKETSSKAGAGAAKTATASLSPAELHERIEQSRRLATSVQRALYGTLVVQNPGLRDRGIKEAGFVVLTESAMPGILAEVSFVSSPTDEQKLRSDGYREKIAEALYRGIARYAASSRGVKVASVGK
jgi:N-acetylmuramoyl-L-alanine amidase